MDGSARTYWDEMRGEEVRGRAVLEAVTVARMMTYSLELCERQWREPYAETEREGKEI
jgi:hypothetical protein